MSNPERKFHRATRFGWELACQHLILKAYAQEHGLEHLSNDRYHVMVVRAKKVWDYYGRIRKCGLMRNNAR